jgi:hypothetical protein
LDVDVVVFEHLDHLIDLHSSTLVFIKSDKHVFNLAFLFELGMSFEVEPPNLITGSLRQPLLDARFFQLVADLPEQM